MLKPEFERCEQLYGKLLREYQCLEAQVPLTADDAVKYGGREFEYLMSLAVKAGKYSDEWMDTVNQLSEHLGELIANSQTTWPAELYDRLVGLEDDVRQINPAWVLAQAPPVRATHPDTLADQLAQGATLCELF